MQEDLPTEYHELESSTSEDWNGIIGRVVEIKKQFEKGTEANKPRSLSVGTVMDIIVGLLDIVIWLLNFINTDLIKDGKFKKPSWIKYPKIIGVFLTFCFKIYKLFKK